MRTAVTALLCGALFGLGLAVSEMAYPGKVLGFLDIDGHWDPSLLLVLGGAVAVTALGFRFILKRPKPLFDDAFETIEKTAIDARLVGGAAIFGIGWGLAGYCPGPGIVSLARQAPDAFVFVGGFLVGSFAYRFVVRSRKVVLGTAETNRRTGMA
jgi:uncharacterized membrane protein YedE/YeeE